MAANVFESSTGNFMYRHLKTTFSNYRLIDFSVTRVYIELENKKMIQQQYLQQHMKFV